MNFSFSARVTKQLASLPIADREAISSALADYATSGRETSHSLSPLQCMIYSMLRFHVMQDLRRAPAC